VLIDIESHFSSIKRRNQKPLKKGKDLEKEIKTETDSSVPLLATLESFHLDSEFVKIYHSSSTKSLKKENFSSKNY
jgi:hypothetical protein